MEGGAYLESLRGEDFYRSKYLERGRARVAVEGGRLVGIVSAVPRRTLLEGATVDSAEIGDLFVDPAFRGRGLFRRLHDGLLADLEGAGIRLVTIRPGPEAEPLLRGRFGYRTLLRIAEWVAALREEGVRRLPLGRVPGLRRLLPRWREGGPAAPSIPCRLLAGEPPVLPAPRGAEWPGAGTLRDAAWIRSRYLADGTPYEVLVAGGAGAVDGVLVTLLHAGTADAPARGWLVDGWTRPGGESAAGALLSTALGSLRDRGAEVAHFWCAKETPRGADPFESALRARGFRRFARGKTVIARAVGGDLALPPAARWMFRMGDTDGI
jgi:GNAT superfamily N-acetyltransferase